MAWPRLPTPRAVVSALPPPLAPCAATFLPQPQLPGLHPEQYPGPAWTVFLAKSTCSRHLGPKLLLRRARRNGGGHQEERPPSATSLSPSRPAGRELGKVKQPRSVPLFAKRSQLSEAACARAGLPPLAGRRSKACFQETGAPHMGEGRDVSRTFGCESGSRFQLVDIGKGEQGIAEGGRSVINEENLGDAKQCQGRQLSGVWGSVWSSSSGKQPPSPAARAIRAERLGPAPHAPRAPSPAPPAPFPFLSPPTHRVLFLRKANKLTVGQVLTPVLLA